MSNQQVQNKYSLVLGTNWDEAVQPGVDSGIWLDSHTPAKGDREVWDNNEEFGRQGATQVFLGPLKEQTGSLAQKAYFETSELLLALYFAWYDNAELVAGKAWKHKFILAPHAVGLFGCLGYEGALAAKAMNSLKMTALKIAYNQGLKYDFSYISSRPSLPGWALPLGITYKSDGVDQFSDLLKAAVFCNNEGDPDFTTNDKLVTTGPEIDMKRAFANQDVEWGFDCRPQPIDNNPPTVDLTIKFNKETTVTDTFRTAFADRVYKKMRIEFDTGKDISDTTETYKWTLNLPRVVIINRPDVTETTPLPWTLQGQAKIADAVPTGMDYLRPYLEIQNGIPPLTGLPAPQ